MKIKHQMMAGMCFSGILAISTVGADEIRPRARDVGLSIGILPTGPLNAITDVRGVAVGQVTLVEGDNVRTGVTVILPHTGNIFREKVPGAVFVGNGFGKLVGSTQVNELGEIESPIALTSTLSVPRVADALLDYLLAMPGNEDVRSINPLVGETNDSRLNDIRGRHITREDVLRAIKTANTGPVEEGAVGAGTGTVAFGFKGGIGTSSRKLPANLGGYTVGVLVQSNFGGILTINGAPVGRELGQYYLKDELSAPISDTRSRSSSRNSKCAGKDSAACNETRVTRDTADGSIMMVVATDAPVDHRNLQRMALRAIYGLARTGSSGSGDSGDYVISFSVAPELRIRAQNGSDPSAPGAMSRSLVPNDQMSPLFLAVIEATEEAIYNSLFRATTTSGNGHTYEALPIDATMKILRRYGSIKEPAGEGRRRADSSK